MRTSLPSLRLALLALATAVGCADAPDPADAPTPPEDDATAVAERKLARFPAWCHTEKLAFTAATACQNDGSVELCIDKNDRAARRYLGSLDPDVRFLTSGGRARCDVATQLLVQYPTAVPRQCTEAGSLRNAAAIDLCRIAALPQVRQIVPTFYE